MGPAHRSRRRPLALVATTLLLVTLLLPALLPASAAAQQARSTAQPKSGGALVAAITGDPPHLNPAATTNIPSLQISAQVYNTLLRMDNDKKLQPELAERWEIAPDGKTYTLYLRKNVKWHDGTPFTAHDAKFSLLEVNRKHNGIASTGLAPIEAIDTPDDHTMVIRLKAASPAFWPWALSDPTGAQIVAKHVYEGKDPQKDDANFNPIGTGPFKFKEWAKGDHITLERNPDYFKQGLPYLDRIVFKVIPDDGARVLALEKGEIDHLPYFSLPITSFRQLEKTPGVVAYNTDRPGAGVIKMTYNLRNERLKVKEVRQAIAYGIDRKALLAKALDGLGYYPKSIIPSAMGEFHNPNVKQYDFSLEKANALLDQAGFQRGPDGTRFSLRITFDRGQESGALKAAADIMRENLAGAGIRLDLTPLDAAAYGDTVWIKWDYDLTMGSYAMGPDPAINTARLFISKNIQPLPARNFAGFNNPQADELFAKGEVEIDRAKRLALYHQVQEILAEELPALPLWEKWYPIANRADVVGLPPGPFHWEPMDQVGWAQTGATAGAAGGGTALAIGLGALVLLAGAFLFWRRSRRSAT